MHTFHLLVIIEAHHSEPNVLNKLKNNKDVQKCKDTRVASINVGLAENQWDPFQLSYLK